MIIRLRRYVEREVEAEDGSITYVTELVLDKGMQVNAIPRTGEYVSYDRYEGGKAFMVKYIEHAMRLNLREADCDIFVVLA